MQGVRFPSLLLATRWGCRDRCVSSIRPLVLAMALGSAASAHAAGALPVRGVYEQGGGNISTGATSVTVNQISTRGVINWTSFSIGQGNTVTINNGNGATLNRVVGGGDASMILGSLTATGSLYLMNPQGVVIGPTGVVTTGGRFLASSLAANTNAFMAGGDLALSNGGNGAVVNMGKIGSTGGDVLLVARGNVQNSGSISAPKGTAELVTGSTVLLHDSSSSRQVFVDVPSSGSVTNSGTISAAQVNLASVDGNVFALAGNSSAIRATGTATRDGHVWLVADKGHVQIHSSVAAADADGSGGTVDSSGTTLNIGNSTVSARQWNLSVPVSYTIDQTTASALSASLNKGTSLDFESTGQNANLVVTGKIDWGSGASLTLAAGHDVRVSRSGAITNTNAGDLTLRADSAGVDNGGSVLNHGTIDWSKSSGIVSATYDMNGSYAPGTLLSNTAWKAAPFSGVVTQLTAYKLVNNLADLRRVAQNLAGNYALGKDIDASVQAGQDSLAPIGLTAATPFTGQFDGFGHAIDRLRFTDEALSDLGLFGVIGKTGVVRNVHVTNGSSSSLSGDNYGLIAATNNGTIAYATSSGGVGNGSFGDLSSGGLVGTNNGLIERSSSSAEICCTGPEGGLVGWNTGTIVQSFATGDSGAGNHGTTGGLVNTNLGTITQSYATGTPGGLQGTGSLLNVNGPQGVVNESFALGAVGGGGPPGDPYGGVASVNQGKVNNNVYWNKDTTMQTKASGVNTGTEPGSANALSTAQMSTPSSFVGWDFSVSGAWVVPTGATHPLFRWEQAKK